MGQSESEVSSKLDRKEEGIQYDGDSLIGIRYVGVPPPINGMTLTGAPGALWEQQGSDSGENIFVSLANKQ